MSAIIDKPMFVIFLDIDGVIYDGAGENQISEIAKEIFQNSLTEKFPEREFKNGSDNFIIHSIATTYFFKEKAVNNLHNLIREIEKTHKVGIVISSFWREYLTADELKIIFSKHDFSKYIIDKTVDRFPETERPDFCIVESINDSSVHGPNCRASEINRWLKNNPKCINYLILDDIDSHLSLNFGKRFVHVNYHKLLTKKVTTEILENLKTKFTQTKSRIIRWTQKENEKIIELVNQYFSIGITELTTGMWRKIAKEVSKIDNTKLSSNKVRSRYYALSLSKLT